MKEDNADKNLKNAQKQLERAYNSIRLSSVDSLLVDRVKGDIAGAIMELNELIYPQMMQMMSGE